MRRSGVNMYGLMKIGRSKLLLLHIRTSEPVTVKFDCRDMGDLNVDTTLCGDVICD